MFKIEMNTNIISNDSWDIFFDKKYFDEQKFKTEDEAKDWCYNYVKRQERNGIELCDADFIIYHTDKLLYLSFRFVLFKIPRTIF